MAVLISAQELLAGINQRDTVVVDCRFNLLDAPAGRKAWEVGHIPGAFYADLDQDLAAPRTASSGRHPLPEAEAFARLLGSWGLTPASRIVVYDDAGGAIAGRLWWLLGWAGHADVSLLDGGLQAWLAEGGTLNTDQPCLQEGRYPVQPGSKPTVQVDEVQARLANNELALIDARDAARFAGKVEPIDAQAGHIPGSLNRPFQDNLQDGLFKPPEVLRQEFEALIASAPGQALAFSCGSGVTACHNLLALEYAGLTTGLAETPPLYVGSWSEWIRSPDRPCEPAANRAQGD